MKMDSYYHGTSVRRFLKLKFTEAGARQAIAYLEMIGYFTDPASSKYHLCVEGGLVTHSVHVSGALGGLTRSLNLTWREERSPILIGLLHDVCKAGRYVKQEDGTYKTDDTQPSLGHGEESLYRIVTGMGICLTEEEAMCIRWHMGAFDYEKNWNLYTQAIKRYPNVLYTHTADMMASHIVEKC